MPSPSWLYCTPVILRCIYDYSIGRKTALLLLKILARKSSMNPYSWKGYVTNSIILYGKYTGFYIKESFQRKPCYEVGSRTGGFSPLESLKLKALVRHGQSWCGNQEARWTARWCSKMVGWVEFHPSKTKSSSVKFEIEKKPRHGIHCSYNLNSSISLLRCDIPYVQRRDTLPFVLHLLC